MQLQSSMDLNPYEVNIGINSKSAQTFSINSCKVRRSSVSQLTLLISNLIFFNRKPSSIRHRRQESCTRIMRLYSLWLSRWNIWKEPTSEKESQRQNTLQLVRDCWVNTRLWSNWYATLAMEQAKRLEMFKTSWSDIRWVDQRTARADDKDKDRMRGGRRESR